MGFNVPKSLPAGKLDSKGFGKPKPVNTNNNSDNITINKNKSKNRNKKWKGKRNGNSSNNPLAMTVPRFNAPSLLPSLQGGPAEVFSRVNAPVEVQFTGHSHAIGSRNGLKRRRINDCTMLQRFNAPSLLPSLPFALQGGPAEVFPRVNVPVEVHFTGHSHAIGSRNGLKRRRILARKKKIYSSLHAPLAPRNTTSFIMRAKKLGGIAPAVTPSPATLALLPTPLLSPGMWDKGCLEEMKKELGVDGYGSMNGLIRLRSYQDRARDAFEGESDVEQGDLMNEDRSTRSVERLEQHIDQGLSRFEMIYPSCASEVGSMPRNLENCVNSQECLIVHLEEENLTLKERLLLVEGELNELRQRVKEIEGLNHANEPMEERCEESCGDVSTPCE